MPTYIVLGKWTDKGIAEVKTSTELMKQGRAVAEKLGGKITGLWVTMGEYDGVLAVDLPNDEAATIFALGLGLGGTARTQTMRAYSEDEFAQLIAKLP